MPNLKWFWLSFAEPGKFLGGVVTQATSLKEAIVKTHKLGINPGGEIQSMEVRPEFLKNLESFPKDKLMTKEEIEAIDKNYDDEGNWKGGDR